MLASSETRYAIAKATGIQQASLMRFASGEAKLSGENVDRLAAYLKLQLRPSSRRKPKA